MDQYEYIRTASRVYGKTIRQIARDTGHSRKTIRKALSGQAPEYRMKEPRKAPVMDPYRNVIDHWILEDQEQPRKQRHTAKRMYDRLVAEYGFSGADSTVRHYLRKRKKELALTKVEAMVPLVPERPGEAEVDWGEAEVVMGGKRCKVHLFVMRPRQSGKPFVRAYPGEAQEMFFDGHVHAFAYYGGVFPIIVYDNLKTAVARVLRGSKRGEQHQFKVFRSHYTFESRFCNVARGNEKGGVEGLVAYARRNLLVPIPEVVDFEDLNRHLIEGCDRLSERILGGREEQRTIDAHFAEEKAHLLPLPPKPFVSEKITTAKVDKYQTVRFEGARYSVPTTHVGLRVDLVIGCETLSIAWGGQTIARHRRYFGSRRWMLDPLHYLDLLHRKIGALDDARPIRDWQSRWPATHDQLLARLRQRYGERDGGRIFVEALMLYRHYEKPRVEAAMERALERGALDAGSIRALIHEQRPCAPTCRPLELDELPQPLRRQHGPPELAKYDRLSGGAP